MTAAAAWLASVLDRDGVARAARRRTSAGDGGQVRAAAVVPRQSAADAVVRAALRPGVAAAVLRQTLARPSPSAGPVGATALVLAGSFSLGGLYSRDAILVAYAKDEIIRDGAVGASGLSDEELLEVAGGGDESAGSDVAPETADAKKNDEKKSDVPEVPSLLDNPIEQFLQWCPGMATLALVGGTGIGFLLGSLFSPSLHDPMGQDHTASVWKQAKEGFKQSAKSGWAMGKNFGYVGMLFAGSECLFEGFRGKHDHWNTASAAIFTGAFLARKAGPRAMLVGSGGFAAFSAAIDWFTVRYDHSQLFQHDDSKFMIDNPPRTEGLLGGFTSLFK